MWVEFYDIFDATVDKNEQLSDIEKFTHLKSHLGGAAAQRDQCSADFRLYSKSILSAIRLKFRSVIYPLKTMVPYINFLRVFLKKLSDGGIFSMKAIDVLDH